MNRQGPGKIDWTDYTFNPVTGCYHGCPYCYARRIAERFGWDGAFPSDAPYQVGEWQGQPVYEYSGASERRAYPWRFAPTFYPDRLTEVAHLKAPAKVFVCSMADLFGDWVPGTWIDQVLAVVHQHPQHVFQFLTKNPERLREFNPWLANCWVGASATDEASMTRALRALADVQATVRFISAEPLLGPLFGMDSGGVVPAVPPAGAMRPLDWLVIGADTTRGAAQPDAGWVMQATCAAALDGVPVWWKDSLCDPTHSVAKLKRWPRGWETRRTATTEGAE